MRTNPCLALFLLTGSLAVGVTGSAIASPLGVPSNQSSEDPREVYFHVGRGNLYADESDLGSGTSYAAGFIWRLSRRTGAGVSVERLDHSREPFAGGSIAGEGTLVSGNLYVFLFPDRDHQLYFTGGAAIIRYERRQFVPDVLVEGEVVDPRRERTETGYGPHGGVGARFNLPFDLAIHVETSLFVPATEIVELPFAWLQAAVGLGYRF